MKKVMSHLGLEIPRYNRAKDPIFHHAIRLQSSEIATTTQPYLEEPATLENVKLENYENNQDLIIDGKTHGDRDESLAVKNEKEDRVAKITLSGQLSSYQTPFFAALPFLSMGLPFPSMYMYPQLSPLFYYPFVQLPNGVAEDEPPKSKPACSFCMENEGSLTCLYYQRNGDDPVVTESIVMDQDIDASLENIQESESLDSIAPIATAKNPGWFGKGYRKGLRKKR